MLKWAVGLLLGVLLGCTASKPAHREEVDAGESLQVHRPVRRGGSPGFRRPPALRTPRPAPGLPAEGMRRTADAQGVERTRQLYWKRLAEAKALYPDSAGYQNHHAVPLYLGGSSQGTTYRLPTAYHKAITQAFRLEWRYGQERPPSKQDLMNILIRVYEQYPIPQLVGIEP